MKAKKLMESLEIPKGMSVILRTSSLEASNESVKWDIEYLIQIYESVLETSIQQTAPFLIYQESSMMARLIRDYCDETIDEVFIDDKKFFDDFINNPLNTYKGVLTFLGIDYDGSKTATAASTNYSLQNYANDVVATIIGSLVAISMLIIISWVVFFAVRRTS